MCNIAAGVNLLAAGAEKIYCTEGEKFGSMTRVQAAEQGANGGQEDK